MNARWLIVMLLTLATAPARAQEEPPLVEIGGNLLANPGFEEIQGTNPSRWDLYVMPKQGAVGRLSNEARTGQRSVMLHIPTPYENDPANNWSQNIIERLGGKSLTVRGYIKTEEAEEAALWLQCWRTKPLRVVAAQSSSRTAPMYGVKDWEEVAFTLEAPAGTEFVTLRCVLRGTGTAWFDDISVALAAPEPPPREKETAKPDKKISGTASDEEDGEAQVRPRVNPAIPDTRQRTEGFSNEIDRLKQANRVLATALDDVRALNAQLMEEMIMLREELYRIRRDVESRPRAPMPVPGEPGEEGGAQPPAGEPTPEEPEAPPLVPRGMPWENSL